MESIRARVTEFCERFDLGLPLLLAPMAGVDVPKLSAAVADAGGMGACGALLMSPASMRDWAIRFQALSGGPFQMNLWIPDPAPVRDAAREDAIRRFLAGWGPQVAPGAGDQAAPDFDSQLDALIAIRPTAVSSIMGAFPSEFVHRLKAASIPWFATATTVAEARLLEAAGADVIVAQGMEAGGHRGSFDPEVAEIRMVGTLALVPAIADAVRVPVIASGGIGDHRGIAAALVLGASAVAIGTGYLRTPEAAIAPAWAQALAGCAPEDTRVTRAFSGRAGRALANAYIEAAADRDAPLPAPHPVQRWLTAPMRSDAARAGDMRRMQAWAGQAAALASGRPAKALTQDLWNDAMALLSWQS